MISRRSQDGAAEVHSPGELSQRSTGGQGRSGGKAALKPAIGRHVTEEVESI